ncbi:hypothetical protein [Desulfosudis oleivorans]|uniref:Uncharacterized protein n=1 Tax=Desulfosudis oleivorans (strain DSM 6200 / JCM 39069 / Hxd3) TaxID=96561 RepID=A8ZT99_DESOH|nr:hypothetical protein [Desulfosudis oleivorans]ABW67782.1 hypothetical protein Dole_1978 [Desulfosudis oleivorans Hxd3]
MALPQGYTVEKVFGQTGPLADGLVRFWVGNGALDEAGARQRVNHVACVLKNGNGDIRGVCSIVATALPLLGNRNIWVYRQFLPDTDRSYEAFVALFNGTREIAQNLLEKEGAQKAPTGIFVILPDEAMARRYPQAFWPETALFYAGRTSQGQHCRIAWLDEPGGWADVHRELEPGFSMEWVFGKVDEKLAEEIVSFWLAEGAIKEDRARQRVPEAAKIGRDPNGTLAGVCTLQYRQTPRLNNMPLWHVRAFVSKPHRRSSLAFCLLHTTVDDMQVLYDTGEERRAPGFFMEVENPSLRQLTHQGLWAYRRFAYLGDDARGNHLRVQYFKGAELNF